MVAVLKLQYLLDYVTSDHAFIHTSSSVFRVFKIHS